MTLALAILKIIGCILAGIIIFLLFLLLVFLLVPIRYSVKGEGDWDDKKIEGILKASWLLHLVSYEISWFPHEHKSQLKILGISIKNNEPAKQDESVQEEECNKTEENPVIKEAHTEKMDREQDERDHFSVKDRKEKKSHKQRRIKKSTKKSKERKQSESINKIKDLYGILMNEKNRVLVHRLWLIAWKMIRHFVPRKGKGDVSFCTSDPSLLGKIIGGISMCPLAYADGMRINPDFESNRFYVKGRLMGKGRVRLIHVVIGLIKVFAIPDFRNLFKKRRKRNHHRK